MEYDPLRKSVAEFVGTFALVFAGLGSVVLFGGGPTNLVGVALANGLMYAVMISTLGRVSGGHFNPAVTFGALLTRHVTFPQAVTSWIAQLAGGVAGALLLKAIYHDNAPGDYRWAPEVADTFQSWEGLVFEGIMAFFLVLVFYGTVIDPKGTYAAVAGLAVGFTLTADILFGGPLTGAAVNPARAFGTQLAFNQWPDFWIYYVGPLVGGAVAALLYRGLALGRRTATA